MGAALVLFAADAGAAAATHSCGSVKVDHLPVLGLKVKNLSCAQAEKRLRRFHATGKGLSCALIGSHEDVPLRLRCKARVRVARRSGSGHRFVEAVITFHLPDCATADTCRK